MIVLLLSISPWIEPSSRTAPSVFSVPFEAGVLADQALDLDTVGHHAARQSRGRQARRSRHPPTGGNSDQTRPARRGRGWRDRGVGRFGHLRRRWRGAGFVAVLGQRAAEPCPFLFFGFLEHLAPPARAEPTAPTRPRRSIGLLAGAAVVSSQYATSAHIVDNPRCLSTMPSRGTCRTSDGCIRPAAQAEAGSGSRGAFSRRDFIKLSGGVVGRARHAWRARREPGPVGRPRAHAAHPERQGGADHLPVLRGRLRHDRAHDRRPDRQHRRQPRFARQRRQSVPQGRGQSTSSPSTNDAGPRSSTARQTPTTGRIGRSTGPWTASPS